MGWFRNGEQLTTLPAQRGSTIFNAGGHSTGRPFVCMAGIREYHIHPSHVGELWPNYKNDESFSLGGLLTKLWHGDVAISLVTISAALVERTVDVLRAASAVERVVLWLGRRHAGGVSVVEVFVPIQETEADYFRIPPDMAHLLARLARSHQGSSPSLALLKQQVRPTKFDVAERAAGGRGK